MNPNENLRRFNGDKNTKKDLREYLIAYFEDAIIDAAYNGRDVKPLAESVKQIKNAFDQLDIDYAIPKKTTDATNQAR